MRAGKEILKDLEAKKQKGLIKDYSAPEPTPAQKEKKKKIKKLPEAYAWLKWNLEYWAKERSLKLETEYQFSKARKFRSDWAIKSLKLLIEYEGGIFMDKGGHNTHTGIQRDIEKYALAHKEGWTVIRFTAKNYKTFSTVLNEVYSK